MDSLHIMMLSKEILIINNIRKLLDQRISLVQANKQQFALLNNKIQVISEQILQLNIANNLPYYLPKLLEFNNYLQQVLAFANKFIVNNYKYLLLKKINYSDDFYNLNGNLKHLAGLFNLTLEGIINQQQPSLAALQDLTDNQELYNKNNQLLVDLLLQQINVINNVQAYRVNIASSKFWGYQELPATWQTRLSKVAWDNTDLERYQLLERLNLSKFSYEVLTASFKQILSELTLLGRAIFIDEELQYPDLKTYWDDNVELRLAWLNTNFILPQEPRCFLLYQQLSKELQHHLSCPTTAKQLSLTANWDVATNEDCDSWVQSLSTGSGDSLSPLTSSSVNSYDYLNEHFKQQLAQASAGVRLLLAAARQQDSFACSQYWYEYKDLHKIWFNYYSQASLVVDSQPSSILLFSSSSQTTSNDSSQASNCQQASLSQQPVTLLEEQDGFKLLLLKIISGSTQETMQYIVGLPNNQANLCITKNHLVTELDFEEQHIINLFAGAEQITAQELQASKDYFKKHFIDDLRLLGALSRPVYS